MAVISPSEKLNLLLSYNFERSGSDYYFTHYGFIEYRIEDDVCRLDSVYIKPEERTRRNIYTEYLRFRSMLSMKHPEVSTLQCGVQGGLDSSSRNIRLVRGMGFKFIHYCPTNNYYTLDKEVG